MKRVLIHVGPHKTGSTAIQSCLAAHTPVLAEAGIWFCHNEQTHEIALNLAREQYEVAERQIKALSKHISSNKADIILLSQEDFSGDLIGRSNRKQIYPKLTKNLRVLKRALRPHQVSFVFFVRGESEWLRSCYVQNVKHRAKFHDFEQFSEFFGGNFKWDQKLAKPIETFNDDLVLLNYSKIPASGVECLLRVAEMSDDQIKRFQPSNEVNKSPTPELIKKLEHINKISEFKPSAWFAKSLVLKSWTPNLTSENASTMPRWPPVKMDMKDTALSALSKRVSVRVNPHDVTDVMPDRSIDLRELAFNLLPKEADVPSVSRSRMEDQSKILKYHLRGKSRLAHLNALAISYLRRETSYTDKARFLFHRIWEEEGVLLVNELPTRWLISTIQTFLDHGKNEAQRQIGTAAYFYANMLKIYEGERSLEGWEQSAHTTSGTPKTKNEFRGLDRYNVGGTDLMLNTNALLLEIAYKDDVAGLVLQEFLLRVKSAPNVFTRLDDARANLGIEIPDFTDTWSFFEPPR